MYNDEWRDYQVIDSGGGEKLERWKDVFLLRPDPQAIWQPSFELASFKDLHACYVRKGGGGSWEYFRDMPKSWAVSWRNLTFAVSPMGFKHTGLFPEQAVNWAFMTDIISKTKRPVSVLNLFAYTGGATCACAAAGAEVCHVDAAKSMVERAGENIKLCGLSDKKIRYIVDDCVKFVGREIRRGRKYDAVIMDPPSYGRGPSGEMWKIESDLFGLVSLAAQLLSDTPLFFLINSYTTGLQPTVIKNILLSAVKRNAESCCYEVTLPTAVKGIELPCGASAWLRFN